MSNDKIIERRVAREILSIIDEIYFSDKYKEYRINYGSNGTRDLIINSIVNLYLSDTIKNKEEP